MSFQAGDVNIGFALQADGLTAVMLMVVTFIGLCIAIYSIGYMHGDPAITVLRRDQPVFVFHDGPGAGRQFHPAVRFWEGVGLCSYLLIGFWFARPAAAAAARKAFLVTRLGDVGLLIGILILWANNQHDLTFAHIFHGAEAWAKAHPTW